MPAITLKDLLRHGLGEMFDAQRQFLPLLDRMEVDIREDSFRARIRRHREETLNQIDNLQRCFDLLGTDAPGIECAAARGLAADVRGFRSQTAEPWAIEVYGLEAVARLEAFELAGLGALANYATATRHDDVLRLLRHNLAETQRMADWIADARTALLHRLETRGGVPSVAR